METKDVETNVLSGRNRFKMVKVLANTLQGRIYLAQDKANKNQWVVIKETWQELVKQGKSRDGHKVPENFEREKSIQLYLSNLPDQNPGYVRCIESWEDENCYYLAMEYCGAGELFDFIRDNHTKGELSKIVKSISTQSQECQKTPNEWSLCVQSMFRQLVDTVSWMHSHGVVHLDLSLENTMLASIDKNQANIKIIDFGVSRFFETKDKLNEKVGKVGYMAPEVYAKKEYSPEKADIWCLGVMLFMMLVGAPPYEFASPTNPAFRFIISGRLRDVLAHWRRLPLVSADALNVMESIFKPENERITMSGLRRHKYVNLSSETEKTESKTTSSLLTKKEEEQTKYSLSKPKVTQHYANGNAQTLTIANEAIPIVTTKKAKDISQLLRSAVGVENLRSLMTAIEKSIEDTKKQSQLPSTASNENPKGEGVVDEDNKNNDQCLDELKQLLHVVIKALETSTSA